MSFYTANKVYARRDPCKLMAGFSSKQAVTEQDKNFNEDIINNIDI